MFLHSSYLSMITAVALGLGLGYILQRGRFCLNTAFRDIIFMKDLTMFRAYLLAVVVAIVGSNFLEDAGLLYAMNYQTGQVVQVGLLRQNFVPVANILGGFIFGVGIVLAGGCASGIVYRLGEGQVAALIAIIGFFFGVVMTLTGMLSPVYQYLKGISMPLFGKYNPSLWNIFGDGMAVKWGTIAAFAAISLFFVLKGKPRFGMAKGSRGFAWGLTGVMVGLLTVAAWWVSSYFGGIPRGLAITTPIRESFNAVLFGSSHSPFPEFSFFGIFRGTWGVFFILAVPLGALLSALMLREFRWKIPPAKEFLTVFFGSILMGIGAVIGGGCNLGQGVTGFSTMAVSSIVTTVAIILGNWTMVYFKFIRPMDADF
ncbi:MAG: YeeE/YedE family protein [Thermodesulfovibrionales bacterium]